MALVVPSDEDREAAARCFAVGFEACSQHVHAPERYEMVYRVSSGEEQAEAIPTYVPTYVPTHLPTYLPTYLLR